MAKLNDVLKSVLLKAGYKADDPQVKAVLETESITNIEVDDDIATGINSKLISMDSAKNHPEIAQVYRAQTLDTVDKKLSNVFDILELDDTEKNAFLEEHSTFKRLDNLKDLIKKARKGKADAGNKSDKDEHDKVIVALNEELRKVKSDLETERTNFQTTRKKDLTNYALRGKIKNFKTILDGTGETTKFATCNTVINSMLEENNAELVADENGTLVLQTKDGSPVFDSKTNVKIEADDFLEKALTKNKLLTVSNTPNPVGEGRITTPISGHDAAKNKKDNTQRAADEFNRKAIEALTGI